MKNFISRFSIKYPDLNLDGSMQPIDGLGVDSTEMIENNNNENKEVYMQKSESGANLTKKPTSSVESILAEGITIRGSITSDSNIKILGFVEGDVTTEGDIIVSGKVNGDIKATNVILTDSKIVGNIVASASIIQNKNSDVTGNITTSRFDVSGVVNGDIKVSESIAIKDTAEIVGNIEAKSISVLEGAIINSHININK